MTENDSSRFSVIPPSSLSQRGPRRRRSPNLLKVAKMAVNGAYASDQTVTDASTSPSSYASFFADNTPEIFSSCLSIGSGYFSLDLDGSMLFTSSASEAEKRTSDPYFVGDDSSSLNFHHSNNVKGNAVSRINNFSSKALISSNTDLLAPKTDKIFSRSRASYLRISDLHLVQSDPPKEITITLDDEVDKQYAHYHYPSSTPPPGLRFDPTELWIAVDDGHGRPTPIAVQAVGQLVQTLVHEFAMDKDRWILEKKPDTILPGMLHGWAVLGPLEGKHVPLKGTAAEKEVLVWTGVANNITNTEAPPVRAEGIIDMAPEHLFNLLLDSSRVHEYNKTSLGREDLLILQNDIHSEGPLGKSITKIVKSMNRVPLLLKSLEFVTLLHGRELDNGAGFVLISRAVSRGEDFKAVNDGGSLHSEILSGVNLMLRIQNDPNRCVMITANHVRSPFLPSIIAKRLGVSAAVGFVHDIRNCKIV